MKLNAENVERIFRSCLSDSDHTTVKGVMIEAKIDKLEIDKNRADIVSMIRQLPETFTTEMGDSFLNLCMTKDGLLWTGFHQTCDKLVVLGLATGKMLFTYGREFWHVMPGNLPLIRIV